MKFIYAAVFIAFSVFSTNARGGGFEIGNGGDGLTRSGHTRLRDLAEQKYENTEFIGSSIDYQLELQSSNLKITELAGNDKNILLKKLTDINNKQPALGFILLDVLKSYNFLFVTQKFSLLSDSSWNDQLDPRIQLAIRLESEIKIDLSEWQNLSSLDRVALLIHEAFYSLSLPLCNQNLKDWCTPDASAVRRLTALAFQKGQRGAFRMLASDSLVRQSMVEDFCKSPSTELTILNFNKTDPSGAPEHLTYNYHYKLAWNYLPFFYQSCSEISIPGQAWQIVLTGYTKVLSIKEINYKDSFGYQKAYSVFEKFQYFTHSVTANNASECYNKLRVQALSDQMDVGIAFPATQQAVCRDLE